MTKFSRKTEMSLIESIKKHEGYVGVVYKDSLGIDTIGYGFAIKDLELDADVCDIILERKLKNLQDRVKNKFHDASQEMLDSLWAKQTPNRAKELSNRVKEVEVGH